MRRGNGTPRRLPDDVGASRERGARGRAEFGGLPAPGGQGSERFRTPAPRKRDTVCLELLRREIATRRISKRTVAWTRTACLLVASIPGVQIEMLFKRRTKQGTSGAHRASPIQQPPVPAQPQVPAGWYPDGTASNAMRWWDGFAWGILQSEHFAAARPEAPEQEVREVEDWQKSRDHELREQLDKKNAEPLLDTTAVVAEAVTTAQFGVAESTPSAAVTPAIKPKKIGRNSKPEWIPANQPIVVDGYVLPGGLLYAGRNPSLRNTEPEPSLIDPTLRVNSNRPDYAGKTFSYWPSYHALSAEARAAYLEWLANGRRDPNVPIGYVFLFMYGLERRALTEIANNAKLAHEVPAILHEMQELLALHPDEHSFQSYGASFVDILELIGLQRDPDYKFQPPPLTDYRWSFPFGLKVELGSLAADGKPVDAEWALAWMWYHEGTRIRTPASRCFDEFTAVFKSLYTQSHGDGLIPKPTKRKMKISYNPASSAIPTADISMDGISDVSQSPTITRELERLADEAQAALDSYSRFIGKNPDASSTLKAQALLPVEILDKTSHASSSLRSLLEPAVSSDSNVDAAELLNLWKGSAVDRLPKQESIQICQLAEKLGFGLEPDPRFGGPALQTGQDIAVFMIGEGAPQVATPQFTAALTLTHLAVAVSKADGLVLEAETEALFGHIETSLGLSSHERVRLEAHAKWLAQSEVKLTGLTKRVAALTPRQRESLGLLLVDIAAVDGVVRPEEVRMISKIYKLLGLDEGTVTSRLHQAVTGASSRRDEPVVVRSAELGDPGSPIPPRPSLTPQGFTLDKASIDAKMRDTAAVSAMLADIFDEDLQAPASGRRIAAPASSTPDGPAATTAPASPLIVGLDPVHTELFQLVTQGTEMSREEFDVFCQTLGLLPNGALDTLNDAAFEASDEPLFDGEDHLTINPYALEEMLR